MHQPTMNCNRADGTTGHNQDEVFHVFTYNVPYAVRRALCNMLDADQTWKIVAGQFCGMDSIQLTLLGQAHLRNASPTEELLNRLDSANVRISELYSYLMQINHLRALELLEPYNANRVQLPGALNNCSPSLQQQQAIVYESTNTLDTPIPSFGEAQSEKPAAIMGGPCAPDYHFNVAAHQAVNKCTNKNETAPKPAAKTPQATCHWQQPEQQQPQQQQQQQQQLKSQPDPGEEIVRLACANNRKRTSISDQEVVNQLRLIMQINYTELKQASNDFSQANILGNGGFASVYRGNWKGTDVAIKRLRCNLMDQALNELTILNSYRIDNILPIYGISIDGPEACLVYQFMANGSLEERLSCKTGSRPLSWQQRALIGEGVAKGLYYLHTLRDKPLVHGDVKSANVLLDSQFVPKLGDFGLARQVFKGKNPQTELCTHCTVSSIHGTSVYLPPEYLRHKILSPAVDVYSYGTVLLEMGTGKRAYDGKRLLIDFVEDETKSSLAQGYLSPRLKDFRLAGDTSEVSHRIWCQLLIKLGIQCVNKIKKRRPDMGQILASFSHFKSGAGAGAAELELEPETQRDKSAAQTFRLSPIDPEVLNDKSNLVSALPQPQLLVNREPDAKLLLQDPLIEAAHRVAGRLDPLPGAVCQTVTGSTQKFAPSSQFANNMSHNDGTQQYHMNGFENTGQQHNWAFMSVEEPDCGPPEIQYQHLINIQSNQEFQAQEESQVEAMIPLLTELGIVGQEEK